MTDTPDDILSADDPIVPVNLTTALEERYLAYALSTIMHRALPDVRDGLKPVHRRLLHAMRLLKLDPASNYKKCARIVGDVIGKYHPHGDQSVYDALVRLAQDFSLRYPLIDGQGNFGNIDGDNAAAMRYTESRMTSVATLLLEGITENAIDFRKTYDGEDEEPIVLPGAFPNLLANGAQGIAVGMATAIPPHNVAELCDAALHIIKAPNCDVTTLLQYVKGPDFPTGGIIIEPQHMIAQAYETGRGGFRTRARWHVEEGERGAWQAVVTEIPYGIQKSRIIEKIAQLILDRKVPILEDVYDDSAEDIRIVIQPKSRNVDPELLMETLFKLSDLESRISLNMNVLVGGKIPRVLNLKEVLAEWLKHRREVLIRRSEFRLGQIINRLELLEGYLIAYLNLDEVIRIIREEDEPKKQLMTTFGLTDTQAEAILNMRLRSLRKLEEMEIRRERDDLTTEKGQIENLLSSEDLQWQAITYEIRAIKKEFGSNTPLGKRRTDFKDAPQTEIGDLEEALIQKEPITVILSEKGWIRAVKGHISNAADSSFKTDDSLHTALHAQTTDKLIVMTSDGKAFTLQASKLPMGRGHGEPVRLMFDLEEDSDIVTIFCSQSGSKRLLATTENRGFVIKDEDLLSTTRKGRNVVTLSAPYKLNMVKPINPEDDLVAAVGTNRKLLIYPLSELPVLARGKGVRLMKFKDGQIADMMSFSKQVGFCWIDTASRTHSPDDWELYIGARAQTGRTVPRGFPKSNLFVNANLEKSE